MNSSATNTMLDKQSSSSGFSACLSAASRPSPNNHGNGGDLSQQHNWRAAPETNSSQLPPVGSSREGYDERFESPSSIPGPSNEYAALQNNNPRPAPAHLSDINNLSSSMGNLAVSRPSNNLNRVQHAPLTKFTIFGELAKETRDGIWQLAMNKNRILEIVWASHDYYQLAPRSRATPALMRVCHESREEAKRFYQLVDFTSVDISSPPCGPTKTYFNPKWDIVYFGAQSCIRSVLDFIQDQQRLKLELRRIAILSSGTLLKCHDWEQGLDDMDLDVIVGGCTMLQALHGIHEDVACTSTVPGVKGLKEVYWVVPTHLLPGIAGNVDESIGFRAARGDGLTTLQIKLKTREIQRDLDHIADGSVLPFCSLGDSMNNWEGDKMPKFEFVSLTPKSYVKGEVFDSRVIPSETVVKLNENDWEFLKETQETTGCHIKVPEQEHPGQTCREIGFYGLEAQVALAIKAVESRLVGDEGLPDNDWPQQKSPDIRSGFTSDKRLDLKLFHPEAAASKYSELQIDKHYNSSLVICSS